MFNKIIKAIVFLVPARISGSIIRVPRGCAWAQVTAARWHMTSWLFSPNWIILAVFENYTIYLPHQLVADSMMCVKSLCFCGRLVTKSLNVYNVLFYSFVIVLNSISCVVYKKIYFYLSMLFLKILVDKHFGNVYFKKLFPSILRK